MIICENREEHLCVHCDNVRPPVPIDDLVLECSCINVLSCEVYNNPTLLAADDNCDECELELHRQECATPVACNGATLYYVSTVMLLD